MNHIFDEDISYIKRKFGANDVFSGKNIVITGWAGFLGFYITHYFLDLYKGGNGPASITLLETFLVGKSGWVDQIEREYADDDHIRMLSFDIGKDTYAAVPGVESADYVIHMASVASPVYYRQYPVETLNANVLGLSHLLEYYTEKRLSGLLFFSSSEIYGDPDSAHIPTDEDYHGDVSCTGPRACYDESKRVGETFCREYALQRGVPTRVARPFNNYGPGMNIGDKRVPADFAKALLDKRDIVILSDGSPTRTFCYVADAIVGYLKILTHSSYDYFNIGIAAPEISIGQLADIYVETGRELFGYEGTAVFELAQEADYLTNNPQRRCPVIDKAQKMLGYAPEITPEDGVRRYMNFLQQGNC